MSDVTDNIQSHSLINLLQVSFVMLIDHLIVDACLCSAMLRQVSDSISLKSPFFLVKLDLLCLIAMKDCGVVKNMNSQLLMKKNCQIFLR